jgi:hypothetical protein
METVVMAITAAAHKTTAAFFMGFPFTKIKRQAKAFCRLNPATLCPLLVPSHRTPNPNKNRQPEICSGQMRNSELFVRIRQWAFDAKQATAKFNLGQGVRFHFLEGRFDMRDLRAVLDHGRAPAPSPAIAMAATGARSRDFQLFQRATTHGRWNCANNTKI